MRQLILTMLILIFFSNVVMAIDQYHVNVNIITLNMDLLLKSDGSIDVTSKMFETYKITNITDGVLVFDTYIAQVKEFTNLKIVDLTQSPFVEYIEVADILDNVKRRNCAGKYSIKDNKISICSPLTQDNQLHFSFQYTLLPDTKCQEIERRQQSFSYQYPIQDRPYTIEYTTRAEKGLNYLSPINCPKEPTPWKKFEIENGIKCRVENLKFSENINELLFLTLTGSITGERVDILEEKEKNKENLKNIVIDVVTLILAFALIVDLNWKGYIRKYFNKSLKNKIVTIVLFVVYTILFIIFRLW